MKEKGLGRACELVDLARILVSFTLKKKRKKYLENTRFKILATIFGDL